VRSRSASRASSSDSGKSPGNDHVDAASCARKSAGSDGYPSTSPTAPVTVTVTPPNTSSTSADSVRSRSRRSENRFGSATPSLSP